MPARALVSDGYMQMLPAIGKLWNEPIYFTMPIFNFIFFPIANLEYFSWCDVIQQIKEVSPKETYNLFYVFSHIISRIYTVP